MNKHEPKISHDKYSLTMAAIEKLRSSFQSGKTYAMSFEKIVPESIVTT